jgi:hypothetical protein
MRWEHIDEQKLRRRIRELAIRESLGKAVDVIDTMEELLKLYPAPTHPRMENDSELLMSSCLWSGSAHCQRPR